ncbi:ankyrin repeat-containing protein [Legionella steigerwaltii]|uniref:Ankyrin repeat-containing protein n=1 Tax=Legionella steigerwaltii TaxID=460 RepID=A0A378LH91_9GAMM|nr:hypothetical protein [Legionella steigerwaltii]KTD80881.1 ankyrin repeat-containing protein [Legionella steigerwaltii]STY23431.1 ankyrin repeat-containing protein [Legionella steigerwaltii]
MPNQGKIISAVNVCLRQKKNIAFILNKKGICAALAALYIKYTLENKRPQFFDLLDKLAALPSTYRIGDNPAIDSFIIKIEKTFQADKYSNYEIQQSDIEKVLNIGNKPLKNEFNFGLTTEQSHWEEIFKKIARENRSYLIFSHNHGIALSFENGKYVVYDPNYNRKIKEFEAIDELVKEIKDCFDYKDNSFGLIIRTFVHPNAIPEHYPSHEELHKIAFADQIDTRSSFFAAMAGDVETLKYLFDQNKIDYDNLSKEYFRPEFNDLLLKKPKSPLLKEAILKGIILTVCVGNYKEAEKLLDHYLQTYTATEEQNELKDQLCLVFSKPVSEYSLSMKKETDHSHLLKVLDQLNISQEPKCQTAYNHLQFLTFVKQETPSVQINQFLNKLSPEQIIKQIQYAAITNQHHVLNLLIPHLATANIVPQSFPSIFNKEIAQNIDAMTLKKLLETGFVVDTHDPDLLTLCMERNDTTIFETYARAWAEQANQPTLWKNIDESKYHLIDLNTPLGSTTLLHALIFLRKNEHVKNAWKDNIPEETIKSALTLAILNGNKEMSLFLQEKLNAKKSHLEPETLEFLYVKGLQEEDLSILSTLVQLNYNVLRNTQDIRALFSLCSDYDDYSIIEKSLAKASPKIKQLTLENSLNWNIAPVITACAEQEPQLFNDYLLNSTTNLGKLAKLNRVGSKIPPSTLSIEKLAPQEQKKLVKNCFKNKLSYLAKSLCIQATWEEAELEEFINELILDKHENGLKLLLQLFPKLKENPKLIPLLAQNHMLIPLDFLLEKETVVIDPELTEQIFTSALANNSKNVVARFLNQGRVTPKTQLKQPLLELIKDAIKKGNDSILEPFIESKLDFGIDFKELFLFSCEQKQEKIANQLLAREITLNSSERHYAIQQLFGDQTASALFDKVYAQGYGRLYQLLLRANVQNPRASLLSSIKNPENDPAFQNTDLYSSSQYLTPLKRAVKDKNEAIFKTLFTQSDLPGDPDKSILDFLKDPVLFASVFPLFEEKYGLKKLLVEALKQKEWATLANLIEKKKLEDLDVELQQPLQKHGIDIVKAYVENLKAHYDKTDVRPQLFKLLESTNPYILAQLAIPYRENIQKTLEEIELNMLQKQLDLNNQIYRHTFNSLPFKIALEQLSKIFEECLKTIQEKNIDLDKAIEHLELVNHLAQIKLIMAGQDISPHYLEENHYDLLEKLIENPRFKEVCQLEFKLYCWLRQFKKPLSEQSEETKKEFNETVRSLQEALVQTDLPKNFVLPEILPYLSPPQSVKEEETLPSTDAARSSLDNAVETIPASQKNGGLAPKSDSTKSDLNALKTQCTEALDYYLKHREENLSYFSYFFDYYRGQTRAQHYKHLIQSAQTEQELYLLEYAILANSDGTQLKKDMALQLKYTDEVNAEEALRKKIQKSYSFTKDDLTQLDNLIDSINQKINADDRTDTESLFEDELSYLGQVRKHQSSLQSLSFFQPKKHDPFTQFLQWIASWVSSDNVSTEGNGVSL